MLFCKEAKKTVEFPAMLSRKSETFERDAQRFFRVAIEATIPAASKHEGEAHDYR
jgi:hypothetical protein